MTTLLVAGIPPKSQRYKAHCLSCKAQFLFGGDEVDRRLDGGMARCAVPCPDCGVRVQWTEHQATPALVETARMNDARLLQLRPRPASIVSRTPERCRAAPPQQRRPAPNFERNHGCSTSTRYGWPEARDPQDPAQRPHHAGRAPQAGIRGRMTYDLTPRETEVLELMCQGRCAKRIASELNIDFRTVQTHAVHIREKLDVHSTLQAVCKVFSERIAALTGSPA
jgi:DNA-binding CsgD family transcriptional regulator